MLEGRLSGVFEDLGRIAVFGEQTAHATANVGAHAFALAKTNDGEADRT